MAINVGILGLAHGHVQNYGKRWVDDPSMGVNIVAAWDHDKERLESVKETLKYETEETVESLLARKDIDAVVISSETGYHAELVVKAAEAKKSIILYKPMALTLKEADTIVEAVEKNGVKFTMGYQMRVDPQNAKIKELIKEKTIGETYLFRRRHGLGTHLWPGFENSWHVAPQHNRDIFADDSAHPIDLTNWIFGVPESVMAEMTTMNSNGIRNDTGVAIFKYPNGMIAEITLCFACTASEITTEVYGSKGAVQQYFGDAVSCQTKWPRKEGTPGLKWYINGDENWTASDIPTPEAHGMRIGDQASHFAAFLKGEREPICTARQGRDSLRMVLACYLSYREGKRVRIDDPRVYEI
ncbi:MAG: Gfo/Idh/MocA family oxidoreductase [Clostridia bacterium]|nr:Gfo/Idh/MocA family oxidoreductase [Clostridia bacterium]